MSKQDKIHEGQVQRDTPRKALVQTMLNRVNCLISELYQGKHIKEMTRKWLSQTPKPATNTAILYPYENPQAKSGRKTDHFQLRRPYRKIKLSSFVDRLLKPIAKTQKSYPKDTTDFINFIERTNVPEQATIVSMDVTSLYTNIPQEEGINTVCNAYMEISQQ